ncbi:MAG: hypothetical protein RBT80_11045 [Candidatus Vecturithrix sp.]|nr:hypothetical protein [Candidatus Vecturithrix sp.]
MKAYSLKITLPRFAYFINLEILPVTTKIQTATAKPKHTKPEVTYEQIKASEQVRLEIDRIQAMYLEQCKF